MKLGSIEMRNIVPVAKVGWACLRGLAPTFARSVCVTCNIRFRNDIL